MRPEPEPATTFAERLRRAAQKIGLPAWFIAVDLLWIWKPEILGVDARHYQAAASAWAAGGDPWAVELNGIPFAAGPHTLLPYLATSLLPPLVSEIVWMALGAVAALWLVRRLGAPIWWFAFPPLFHAVWNGNPQTLVVALLILGGPLGATAGAMLKSYALIPLLARPRLLAIAVAALIVTLPLVPWQRYLADGLGISMHLATSWNGSATRLPILIPPVLLALWVLRRDGAEWLAVPAAWPATQFYYVSLAIPAVVRRPLAAAALALPAPLMAPIVAMALAAAHVWRARRVPLPEAAPGPATPGSVAP